MVLKRLSLLALIIDIVFDLDGQFFNELYLRRRDSPNCFVPEIFEQFHEKVNVK